jgi:signal transduction histidine kinase
VVSSLDVLESIVPPEADPNLHAIFKIAERSTERIQRLTNSLLDVNRLKTGQAILVKRPTSLIDLVREAVEALEMVAASKQQTLQLDLPEELPSVEIDADMIRRVLINLLENAIKYTPTQGQITAGAQQMAQQIEVWVRDTGRGIPAEQQQVIFDKFARLRTPDEDTRGLGLGLTFCRLAVEAHGGRIWVESQVGAGSRFAFTLPLAAS